MSKEKNIENNKSNNQTVITEVFNAITHGIAVILSIVGLVFLILKAHKIGGWKVMTAYCVYGSSLIALFLGSTLYHSLSYTKAYKVFQHIDHLSIYLLIAGTYTPYLLVGIQEAWSIYFLIGVWVFAILGIIYELALRDKYPKLSSILYLILGWVSIFIIKPLLNSVDKRGFYLLLLGGILYTVGILFYKKKDNPWMHVIWHVFVVLGAISMYFSIYLYVPAI